MLRTAVSSFYPLYTEQQTLRVKKCSIKSALRQLQTNWELIVHILCPIVMWFSCKLWDLQRNDMELWMSDYYIWYGIILGRTFISHVLHTFKSSLFLWIRNYHYWTISFAVETWRQWSGLNRLKCESQSQSLHTFLLNVKQSHVICT